MEKYLQKQLELKSKNIIIIRHCETSLEVEAIQYLGFNTNPKNGRVKALSKACLDRTYLANMNIMLCKQ